MRAPLPSDTYGERLARVEQDNEQCAETRDKHTAKIDNLEKVMNQTTGAIRMLVVLWVLITGVAGVAAAQGWVGPSRTPHASAAP